MKSIRKSHKLNLKRNPLISAADLEVLTSCLKNLSASPSFLSMKDFTQHGRTDCLLHSISVSYYSLAAAGCLPFIWDKKSLVKGALLHDFFLYDWHKKDRSHRFHGFTHPSAALANARKEWILNEKEADIIRKHMFPLIPSVPRYRESILVCLVDKLCSAAEILRLRPSRQVKTIYLNTISSKAE